MNNLGEKRNCAHLRKKKYLDQVLNEYSWGRKKKCSIKENKIYFKRIKFLINILLNKLYSFIGKYDIFFGN